uniref:Uncharacterized protein n=1 Tax=Cuerna arida TaxID=1464854 RepID=A0A1B6GC06_9HEMI
MDKDITIENVLGDENCSTVLTLSPIAEMNESNITGSSITEEQDEIVSERIQDHSFSAFVVDPLKSISKRTQLFEDVAQTSCCSAESPVTPPEVLRKRLFNLKTQFEHLTFEHEELIEFTQLEKQVHHMDCVPVDQVKVQEDELARMNEKIQILMSENSSLRKMLELNKSETAQLEAKMITTQQCKNAAKEAIKTISFKIKEYLQDEVEDVIKIHPTLEYFLRDTEYIDLEDFRLDDFQMLLDVYLFKRSELMKKDEIFNLNNQEFCKKNNLLTNQITELENMFTVIEEENTVFKEKLNVADCKVNKLLDALNYSQKQQEVLKALLKVSERERNQLQTKIQNLKKIGTIEDFQEDFVTILNVIQRYIDSWDYSNKLLDVFAKLTEDKQLLPCINIIFNSSTQKVLINVINNLKSRLMSNDDSFSQLESLKDTHNSYIEYSENELKLIKVKVQEMTCYVKEVMSKSDLLQNRIENMEKNYVLIKHIDLILNTIQTLLDSWTSFSSFKEKLDELFENQDFVCFGFDDCSNIQTRLCCVLKKFQDRLHTYVENNNRLSFKIESLESSVKYFENKTNMMKLQIKELEQPMVTANFNKKCTIDGYNKYGNGSKNRNDISVLDNHDNIESEDQSLLCSSLDTTALETTVKLEVTECYIPKSVDFKVNISDVQKELMFILNELQNISEEDTFVTNREKFQNLIIFKDSNICTGVFHHYNNIVEKIRICEQEKRQLLQNLEEFNNNKELLKNENSFLKRTISNLENKIEFLKSDFRKEEIESKQSMYSCVEELKTLKEQMVLEITSLDCKENKESLLCQSSNEIFNKLMQNIMKKEKELELNLQERSIESSQAKLNEHNNKIVSQKSWIKQLEKENEELNSDLAAIKKSEADLLCRLKSLMNEFETKNSEISYLENKISDLTLANKNLKTDVMDLTESVETVKQTAKNLQNRVRELYEELNLKTNLNIDLETKISFLTKEREILNVENSATTENSTQTTYSLKNEAIENPNSGCSCLLMKIDSVEDDSSTEYTQDNKSLHDQTCLMDQFRKENLFLKDLFNCITNDVQFSEQLNSCLNKFHVLKDVVQLFINKITEIETCQNDYLYMFQKFIESKTKRLSDFEKSINKMYDICSFDDKESENNKYLSENNPGCDSLHLFKLELDLAKEDCMSLTYGVEKFQHHANGFYSVLQTLTNKFQTIENETTRSVKLIEDLHKSLEAEQLKNTKLKTQVKIKNKQVHSLKANILHLENKVEDLQLQSANILRDVSRLNIDIPVDNNDVTGKINYLNTLLKEYSENKNLMFCMAIDIDFFSNQCDMMRYYIESVERKLLLVFQEKGNLASEVDALKDKILTSNKQLIEANVFFNKLISKLPIKVTTLNQAIDAISQICSDYINLKDVEVNFIKEIETKDAKHLEELKSLKVTNSSLKVELSKCEDNIRTLRSELRSIRMQCQKRRSDGSDK